MKGTAIFMNYAMTGLVVLSLCYQVFHGEHMQLGNLVTQLFILATPLITIWALKSPSTLSRRTALAANISIVILVVLAAMLGLGSGGSSGAVVAMAVLFIPFFVNAFVLTKKAHTA